MHKIEYKNAFSDWREALPLGNGHFGGMGYLDRENGFVFALNHYDVYYKILPWYARKAKDEPLQDGMWSRGTDAEFRRRGLEAHADPHHPAHNNYNIVFQPELSTSHGVLREGFHSAIAGSLALRPRAEFLMAGQFKTALHIEEACLHFEAGVERPEGKQNLHLRSFAARGTDVVVSRASQTGPGAIETLELSLPQGRLWPVEPRGGGMIDDGIFYLENRFYPIEEDREKYPPFRYIIAIKVLGARADLEGPPEPNRFRLRLSEEADRYTVLTTVVSGEVEPDPVAAARRTLTEAAANLDGLEKNHQEHWRGFFGRSSVSLPDPMLETLWYMNLYSLASCSGEGSKVTFPEACGLNGLWDIKGPSQWGSLWYWDVNIEQAFWPVFTANHLELAKPFHRGLLSWAQQARTLGRTFHKIDAIAPDYPLLYYMSIWAWCAQYFWWYYTYSLDRQFLKETAYPLFKELLFFYGKFARYDKDTGALYIYPDVAPEQGPLTRNSMSTLSCLKFLLKMGIESNTVLGEDPKDRQTWETMLAKCPPYATEESPNFGVHYKDSEWAEGLLFLAHSGILKPVYPIREMTKRSRPEVQARALGTLRYADGLQTHGTHNIWPAAAAAVLGLGDEAVRMLYDRGISLMLNPNGLFSEETDRWIQSCLVNCSPVYNPPLIEGGSTVVAVINEMLLQSYDGLIEVFPAIPIGAPTHRYHEGLFNPPRLHLAPVAPWNDCAFENLLAEGAFEVSAERRGGKTACVRIKSLRGTPLRLMNPFPNAPQVRAGGNAVEYELKDGVLSFATAAGETYTVTGSTPEASPAKSRPEQSGPQVVKAFTRRRVFLGKDEHTDYYRDLDGALLDYYPGHLPQSKLTIYKFDFTDPKIKKDYFTAVDWQWHVCGKQGGPFIAIPKDQSYTYAVGRGWAGTGNLHYADRGGPDDLRRDFVTGQTPAEFLVDLRKGLYQIVLVTGDADEPVQTKLAVLGGTFWDSGHLRPGRWAVGKVLLNHERDGKAICQFSSGSGINWNACALIINAVL